LRKEQFKTVLLTILFLLTIILTQQLWITIPLAERLPSSNQAISKDIENTDNIKMIANIVSPQSFIVNFGGGLHTVLYSDFYNMGQEDFDGFWPETLLLLKDNYFEEGATVEEVTKERWEEANKSKSILMDFNYSIPLSVIRNMAEGKEAGISGKIPELDSILVGTTDGAGVFMASKTTDKYYQLKGKNSEFSTFSTAISLIDETGYNIYYDINNFYSEVITKSNVAESDRILPVSLKDNIPRIQVVQEIDTYNESQIEAFSSTFFGGSFDFIRKINETNGSVIYMYGYGRRVLKIDESGFLEYVEEIDPQKSTTNTEYWEGIKEATRFVSEHGGWPNKDTYLKEVNIIEDNKRKGYEFIFGYRLNGLPVYYNEKLNSQPIEIQVMGKQVIRYKRHIKKEKIAVNFLEEEDINETKILTPLQIIDNNFEKINQNYQSTLVDGTQESDNKDLGNEVLTSISSIKLGYYDQPMREPNKLIPIWIIRFDPYTYYFDAYNGKLVYQSEM